MFRFSVPAWGRGSRLVRVALAAVLWASASAFTFLDPVARKTEEGNALFGEEAFDDALSRYREAQTDRPEAPELHFNVGDALYKQGAFKEAAASFHQAVEAGDASLAAGAWYNLGNAFYRQQDFDQAAAAYGRSLEIDPDDVDAKINLELALEQQQQQQEQKQDDKDSDSDENKDEENQQDEQDQQDQQNQQDRQDQQNSENSQDPQESDDSQGEQEPQENPPANPEPQDREGESGSKSEQDQQLDDPRQQGELTQEEAQRILDAMRDREAEAQKRRRVRVVGPRYDGKGW